jgi:serine/threonine protein kinase
MIASRVAPGSSFARRAAVQLPMRFGPYLLTDCLAVGGMAAVYKGKRHGSAGFEKQVVVKTILPHLAKSSRFVRLFEEEARLSAQLLHNNVVRVNDFGIVRGTPFLELEYLCGMNLLELWNTVNDRGERLPVPIALVLASEVCRGLSYAHSFVDEAGRHRPIIHRDVSPANVMICRDGSVKLLDFGLACLTRGETIAIETFQGKIAYMSPEQLDRRQLDRRADVFAFGTLLHELLTGRRLFAASDDGETLRRIQSLLIDPPSALNPAVPSALDVIVLRALMHDPDQRYQSAAEMLAALEELSELEASRKKLLSYLGSVGPDVFTTACDSCGTRLPCGVECRTCKTVADPTGFGADESPGEAPHAAVAAFTSGPRALQASLSASTRQVQRLRRQVVLLYSTACALWRRFQTWLELARAPKARR